MLLPTLDAPGGSVLSSFMQVLSKCLRLGVKRKSVPKRRVPGECATAQYPQLLKAMPWHQNQADQAESLLYWATLITKRGILCILRSFSIAQAGAPGTGKTTFIQNLASAYGSQDDGGCQQATIIADCIQ